jgi:hypothetical protein
MDCRRGDKMDIAGGGWGCVGVVVRMAGGVDDVRRGGSN